MSCFREWDASKDFAPMTLLVGEYLLSRLEEHLRILELANDYHQIEYLPEFTV